MENLEKIAIQEKFRDVDFLEYKNIVIPFNNKWRSIAISVSGGADSALLAYLLSKHVADNNLKTKIYFISNIRMWETRPWQRYDSLKVFEYIKTLFPTIEYHRHENFIPPELETASIGKIIPDAKQGFKGGDQILTVSFANYVCRRENINAWYAALTKNPLVSIPDAPDNRDEDFTGNIDELFLNYKGVFVIHPFKYKTKETIINLYKDLNILDLLKQTRSCEGDKNSAPEVFGELDFYSYVPYQNVPTCNKCFWCKEREWALKQNNL